MQRLKQRFLDYLNKTHFDYTQGPVDPHKYHSIHMTFIKLFNVSDSDHIPYWHYITPSLVVFSGVLASFILTMSLIHYIQTFEFHLITESGTYLIVMLYKLCIISCPLFNKKEYQYFQKAVREDFDYIGTRGLKYRDKFFEKQKLTFKASVISSIFIIGMGVLMMIFATSAWIYTIIFYDKIRPLPFPFYVFGWDLHISPMYEITFFFSVLFTGNHVYTYSFMIQSQITWVRQITCKADIMIWRIQDLLVDVKPARNKHEQEYYALLITHRMREIIMMHHSMITLCEAYAAVYKKCLLFEQKLAAPLICLTAYCAAEQFEAGKINGILILLCGSVIILVSIPCYLCTYLAEKVESVSDACWDMPFWNAGPVVRPYVVLIMQRSMRPLPIQTAGFEDISLQTYSNIMARAYSCFNMLRQTKFDLYS